MVQEIPAAFYAAKQDERLPLGDEGPSRQWRGVSPRISGAARRAYALVTGPRGACGAGSDKPYPASIQWCGSKLIQVLEFQGRPVMLD